MDLGIWCDYGTTLTPTEGIGVFVANLVQGLVHQPSIDRIVLVSRRGHEHLLESLRQLAPDKIQVLGNRRLPFHLRKTWKLLRQLDRRSRERSGRGITESGLRGLAYRWLARQVEQAKPPGLQGIDLWLLPYVALEQDFAEPTVVMVHDLIPYHFGDGGPPEKLEAFKRLVNQVTERATLVACMSNFILANDLHGTLGLPTSKTRMVRPAVPRDFAHAGAGGAALPSAVPAGRYLLYPAAFRGYKNHRLLVESLPLLNRDRAVPLHLVFTGIKRTPRSLVRLIEGLRVSSWVHVLGKVSRGELEALYRHAHATAVPSLYEQGSFPLMEALFFDCPILAADIPALREQLEALGDAAIYFDPHSPAAFVRAVEDLERDRGGRLTRQVAGFARMKQRTWQDAAREWCAVFDEALAAASRARPA
jgi:glycosyltransferase involved in cell wall biosynthesis